jgi:transposase
VLLEAARPRSIHITYGYSRDHRPDLKQFVVDLMCSGDGDIPLYLRVGDGNEADSAMFAQLVSKFRQQWQIDALFVADAALYNADNLIQMKQLRWVSRVPATLKDAQELLINLHPQALVPSELAGYKIAALGNQYSGINQRWLLVESQARLESDLAQLDKQIAKQLARATTALNRLAALAMVMGLCLLVYGLDQRCLRQTLAQAKQTIDNQLGKPTSKPTLRWVFQCFMSIHLLTVNGVKQITNLTPERIWILQFFGSPTRNYYLLS